MSILSICKLCNRSMYVCVYVCIHTQWKVCNRSMYVCVYVYAYTHYVHTYVLSGNYEIAFTSWLGLELVLRNAKSAYLSEPKKIFGGV